MSQRILIIDDSLALHKLIEVHLSSCDVELESVFDGESGVAAAAKLRPALILLDVEMPGIDGLETCRRLKAGRDTADIPVIFLTADINKDKRLQALHLGALDYVTKPFKPSELRAKVTALLRMQRQLEEAAN
jgi:two-component system phosphate regulon response regulator PhoB